MLTNPIIRLEREWEREREMVDDRLLERERQQIEQIRQLDFEELQVEEVDDFHDSSDDDDRAAT